MTAARYAPVAPLQSLLALADMKILGDYHLLIAPIVLNRDWQYADFFTKRHPGMTVIMDNGVIESGAPMGLGNLISASKLVDATVLVLPDTIDDKRMTVKQVRNAMREWERASAGSGLQTMGVVQGRTLDECLDCAADLVEAGVDWLAVPRGLTKNLKTRVPLVRQVAEEHGKPIHVLGFSDNIEDDIKAAVCHPLVQGIDAATPMWADRWLPLHPPTDEPMTLGLGKRPEDFWHNGVPDQAGHNAETVRRWLRDAAASL